MKIGRSIRHYRVLRGMSLDSLAHEAGISRFKLRRLESDRNDPSIFDLEKICQCLGVDAWELVRYAETGE